MDFKRELAAEFSRVTALPEEELLQMIEVPPDSGMGDYALPCFKLAKSMRRAPQQIASDLARQIIHPEFISRVEVAGSYINFFVDKLYFAKCVLADALDAGERYGSSAEGSGKTVVIDYSSINIAKPFHIGHLSTTAIGNSLYRIYRFLGYNCVGVNHLGDWGTQFGKLISAYKHWGNREEIERGSVKALLELYVRFHEEAEKDPTLNDEARAWFKKIEDGDMEALEIFEWFKELTLRDVDRVYRLLGVHFDSYAGESFYNDKMQPVIDELKEKNLLELSEGAYVVRLDDYNLPPCIILKSDGATLYSTRDLAAAFYRKKEYNFYKCLYVVAYQQNLHFKQVFKVIELMGYDFAHDMEHVAFGMVSLEDGTLSTRKGKVVFLEEVLNNSIKKAFKIIEEKNPGLENKEDIARDVGVGAVVYSVLSNNRIKDIVFDPDRVLNFDGETGPYVQYTHARTCSLFRRLTADYSSVPRDYTALDNDQALLVLKFVHTFGEAVKSAQQKNEPCVVTRHITDLAQAFNKYYYDYRIVDEDANKTAARLDLARVVKNILKTGLYLIGVNAPERM